MTANPNIVKQNCINPSTICAERYFPNPDRGSLSIIVPFNDVFIINVSHIIDKTKEPIDKPRYEISNHPSEQDESM